MSNLINHLVKSFEKLTNKKVSKKVIKSLEKMDEHSNSRIYNGDPILKALRQKGSVKPPITRES